MWRTIGVIGALSWGAFHGATARGADDWEALRTAMVRRDVEEAGIRHPKVLRALRETPRHEFVPAGFRDRAYLDVALPIGEEQTISPPYVVAYMTQQLDPQPTDRVLEIGTGSGYQAAVLSQLTAEVDTIEIVPRLASRAERTLKRLGYDNVHVRTGDGYQGWPERAPFDKIIVTCSPEQIPQPLIDQLREGGQMVIPVGERYRQNLYRVTKRKGQLQREALQATLFVPMTGAAEDKRQTLPDPTQPSLFNGSFEQPNQGGDGPAGWHYLRQTQLATESHVPQGQRFLRLHSAAAHNSCQALQGLAVDGRKVTRLELTAWVRGVGLSSGDDEQASLIITFYDDRRAAIDQMGLGPWTGSFAWRHEKVQSAVPLAAREAIVRVGLHGGTGQLDVDAIELRRLD